MTVQSEVSSSETYIGNGSARIFAYPFKVLSASHVRAVVIGVNGEASDLPSGAYDVSGVGSSGGGNVTLPLPLAVGEKLTLVREMPLTQETALPNGGAYFAETVEATFDRTVMQIQQLSDAVDLAVKVEPGQPTPTVWQVINAEANAIAAQGYAEDAEDALDQFRTEAGAAFAVKLNTLAVDGQTEYTLLSSVPATAGHLHVNAYVGGVKQPKDGLAYTITGGGANILFSEQPSVGTTIYVEGAATYAVSIPSGGAASTTVNDSTVPGTTVRDALEAIHSPAVWSEETSRTNAARARDTYCILDAPAGADPTGSNDSTVALKQMVAEGVRCELTTGNFVWDAAIDPIGMVLTHHGQHIFGHGAGTTSGGFNTWGREYRHVSRITFAGTGQRIVRTRREHRQNAGSPQDAPMSATITRAADGISLADFCVWLDCDYTNTNRYNYGADWDIGVHDMCRTGSESERLNVVGHFRKFGHLRENTSIEASLPIPGYDIPNRTSRGSDDATWYNCYTRGARMGWAILGAKKRITGYDGLNPIFDPNYYDSVAGASVLDRRGSFGSSDSTWIACKFFGPDHHSGWRLANPRGDLNHLLEPEDMPGCVWIDGWANNADETRDQVNQGFSFIGRNRFETIEAFHIRLDRANRVELSGHVDYGGYDQDPDGNAVTNYGSVTGTTNTRNVRFAPGWMSNPRQASFGDLVRGWTNENPESGISQGQIVSINEIRKRTVGDTGVNLTVRKRDTGSLRVAREDGTVEWAFFDSGNFGPADSKDNELNIGSSGARVAMTFSRLLRPGAGNVTWTSGSGSPNGVVPALKGSMYTQEDATDGNSGLWFKASGTGSSGWILIS